nr:uncharacterized protein LOC110377666 isoform X1 [Helicoverpa armigera]
MIGQNTLFSDYGYGSGSSSNHTSWPSSGESWSPLQAQPRNDLKPTEQKPASFQDLVTGKCTLDDIMKDFQMNGQDSTYPSYESIWSPNAADSLSGMGPSSVYLRQKSWPSAESSPAPRLQRPRSEWIPSTTAAEFNSNEFSTSTPFEVEGLSGLDPSSAYLQQKSWAPAESPVAFRPARPRSEWLPSNDYTISPPVEEVGSVGANADTLTAEHRRVLNSLPDRVLFPLLQILEQERAVEKRFRRQTECRFCKNNGEREKFYTSHSLRDAAGRVTCPVLSAFRCRRCGATGARAHTDTYCPLATPDERMKSAAMMRSVRMASGRRRGAASQADYVMFGDATPSCLSDNQVYSTFAQTAPLDPLWAALEQKLSI